jgi:hypothetical protein
MIRGIEKKRIVLDEQDRKDFVRRLGLLAVKTKTAVYAWALMSNHAHLLVCSGAEGEDGQLFKLAVKRRLCRTCVLQMLSPALIQQLAPQFNEVDRL